MSALNGPVVPADTGYPALTTIFTPPSSCRTHWTYEASFYNSVSGGLLLQNALSSSLDTACFPPSFSNAGRASVSQIYSPGQCPIGYSTPAQYVNGAITTLVCCQTSFSYFSTLTMIDNYSITDSVIFAGCISTYSKASGATTVIARANNTDLQSSTTVNGPVTMWGQPIEVAFQQADLSYYTTSASSTSTSSTSSATAQPSSIPTTPSAATATSPPSTSSAVATGGLSPGAQAGIGACVGLVGLSLIGVALFLFWRKRRVVALDHQPTKVYFNETKEKEKGINNDNMLGELEQASRRPPELDSSTRAELSEYNGGRVELDSGASPPQRSLGR